MKPMYAIHVHAIQSDSVWDHNIDADSNLCKGQGDDNNNSIGTMLLPAAADAAAATAAAAAAAAGAGDFLRGG